MSTAKRATTSKADKCPTWKTASSNPSSSAPPPNPTPLGPSGLRPAWLDLSKASSPRPPPRDRSSPLPHTANPSLSQAVASHIADKLDYPSLHPEVLRITSAVLLAKDFPSEAIPPADFLSLPKVIVAFINSFVRLHRKDGRPLLGHEYSSIQSDTSDGDSSFDSLDRPLTGSRRFAKLQKLQVPRGSAK